MALPRIGVIGFQMGANHAELLYNHRIANFVAGVDLKPEAQARVELLGGTFYADYEQMLEHEELDAVIIALPHHLHAPVAAQVAARGLHMYIDKPLAHTLEDCDRIIRAADGNRVRVMMGYQRRYGAAIQKARELVQNGQLGKLVGVLIIGGGVKADEYFETEWKASREKGGGPLFMNACHDIDEVRYVAGDIVRVSAEVSHEIRGFSAEDTAAATLCFENGAVGTLFITDTAMGAGLCPLTFMGTKASLTICPLRLYTHHWPWDPQTHLGLSGKTIDLHVEGGDPQVTALQQFVEVIAGNAEPLTTLEDARRTTAVIRAIIEAGETHRAVEVSGT